MVSVTRLAAGALLVAACNRTPPPADGHHVVVISIDTLRADHLGCYGHPDVRSPRLDQLASQGALFEHAIAAAPTTLASHTSLLTGRWPHHHGVPRNGFVIDSSNLMLAEVLREAGYQTAAFIGGYPLKDEFAFDQGFETFDQEFPKKKGGRPVWGAQRDAELVDRAVFAWLDQASGDRPLFLFVHYFDVHPPYRTPAPWHDAYLEGPDYGINGSLRDIRRLRTEVMEGRPAALRDSTVLHARYKAGISWTDHHVGVLLDGLEERGILDHQLG